MKKKYTHLFFDLDNTLWDFKSNSPVAMKSTYDTFNIANIGIPFEHFFTVYRKHNDSLWADYREKKISKKELIENRFLHTFKELNIKNIDAKEIDDYYLQTIAKQPLVVDGAFEILDYAKQKGYRMFILSNGFKEIQQKKMESAGITSYFEKVFVSEDVKVPKPDRKIFEYAIKSTNAKKQQSLMIGDDWEADIVGALNFGIDSVFYGETKRNEATVTQIRELKELQSII